jgi:hypothetical protein
VEVAGCAKLKSGDMCCNIQVTFDSDLHNNLRVRNERLLMLSAGPHTTTLKRE